VDYFRHATRFFHSVSPQERGIFMNSIIYIVGLVVIVIFILSFFGLR
jgi:small-conductance mechanosensitive channel